MCEKRGDCCTCLLAGTYNFSNGNVYDGEFKGGKLEGTGENTPHAQCSKGIGKSSRHSPHGHYPPSANASGIRWPKSIHRKKTELKRYEYISFMTISIL